LVQRRRARSCGGRPGKAVWIVLFRSLAHVRVEVGRPWGRSRALLLHQGAIRLVPGMDSNPAFALSSLPDRCGRWPAGANDGGARARRGALPENPRLLREEFA